MYTYHILTIYVTTELHKYNNENIFNITGHGYYFIASPHPTRQYLINYLHIYFDILYEAKLF